MAKDRLAPCEFYECKGKCSKHREASYEGYCQYCSKYMPRKGSKNLVRAMKQKYREKKYKEVY